VYIDIDNVLWWYIVKLTAPHPSARPGGVCCV
jgi:hypothetical protein